MMDKSEGKRNAFSFLMANRHKQDEIIKNLDETTGKDPLCEEVSDSDVEVIHSRVTDTTTADASNESIIDLTKHLKGSNINSSKHLANNNLNAFQYLMYNQLKIGSEDNSDCSDAGHEKTTSRKRKYERENSDGSYTATVNISEDSCNSENNRSMINSDLINENKVKENLVSRNEDSELKLDSKLDLINENEYFDIEETFKEEILECVSKKKKKKRFNSSKKSKTQETGSSNSTRNHVPIKDCIGAQNEVQVLEDGAMKENEPDKNNLKNYVQMFGSSPSLCMQTSPQVHNHQPNIKSFFKPIAKKQVNSPTQVGDNSDIKSTSLSTLNTVKPDSVKTGSNKTNFRDSSESTISANSKLKLGDEMYDKDFLINHVSKKFTKQASSQLKTKTLRELRIHVNRKERDTIIGEISQDLRSKCDISLNTSSKESTRTHTPAHNAKSNNSILTENEFQLHENNEAQVVVQTNHLAGTESNAEAASNSSSVEKMQTSYSKLFAGQLKAEKKTQPLIDTILDSNNVIDKPENSENIQMPSSKNSISEKMFLSDKTNSNNDSSVPVKHKENNCERQSYIRCVGLKDFVNNLKVEPKNILKLEKDFENSDLETSEIFTNTNEQNSSDNTDHNEYETPDKCNPLGKLLKSTKMATSEPSSMCIKEKIQPKDSAKPHIKESQISDPKHLLQREIKLSQKLARKEQLSSEGKSKEKQSKAKMKRNNSCSRVTDTSARKSQALYSGTAKSNSSSPNSTPNDTVAQENNGQESVKSSSKKMNFLSFFSAACKETKRKVISSESSSDSDVESDSSLKSKNSTDFLSEEGEEFTSSDMKSNLRTSSDSFSDNKIKVPSHIIEKSNDTNNITEKSNDVIAKSVEKATDTNKRYFEIFSKSSRLSVSKCNEEPTDTELDVVLVEKTLPFSKSSRLSVSKCNEEPTDIELDVVLAEKTSFSKSSRPSAPKCNNQTTGTELDVVVAEKSLTSQGCEADNNNIHTPKESCSQPELIIDSGEPISEKGEKPALRRSHRTVKTTKLYNIFDQPTKKTKEKLSTPDSNSKTISNKDGVSSKKKQPRKNRKLSRSLSTSEVLVYKNPENSNSSSDLDIVEVIAINSSNHTLDVQKIAPIFVKKKEVTISPTKLKARSDFLFSDVPETLKKSIAKSSEVQNSFCPFPRHAHIRQDSTSDDYCHLPAPKVPSLKEKVDDLTTPLPNSCLFNKHFKLKLDKHPPPNLESFPPLSTRTVAHILAYLMSQNKRFPTLSVYNAYKSSREEYLNLYTQESEKDSSRKPSDCREGRTKTQERKCTSPPKSGKSKRKKKAKRGLSSKRRKLTETLDEKCEEDTPSWYRWIPYEWTQAFAPLSSEFMIGNKESVNSLKDVITEWKNVGKTDSQSSSDSNDSDDGKDVLNSIVLTGPSGVGKTAVVYAVARDFGYKVLEVNASSYRQGKQLLSNVSEATLSHSLSGNGSQIFKSNSSDQSQPDSQEQTEKTKGMSLILIEDIDIVFEEADEGFWSAVNTLLCTSKRPIIMTSSLQASSVTKKIKGNYKTVHFKKPDPHLIAQHLQLLCLANGVFASCNEIELLVSCNKEDIRKSILDLQLWVNSGLCQVQWWKLDNRDNVIKAQKKGENNNNVTFQTLFPDVDESSAKSVELPISMGCIWSKKNVRGLKEQGLALNQEGFSDWMLLSANCSSMLPFVENPLKRVAKYPLKDDDPCLKKANLWQTYNWLILDDDDDEGKIPAQAPSEDQELTKSTQTSAYRRANNHCLDSLARFVESFTDFDIFSSTLSPLENRETSDEFRDTFWTPPTLPGLEYLSSRKSTETPQSFEVCSDLIPQMSKLSLKRAQEEISKATSPLPVDGEHPSFVNVREKRPPFSVIPHRSLSNRESLQHEELNQVLSSLLPYLGQLCRSSSTIDYFPFIREIARLDHIGERVKKQFKRTRRHCKYFAQLGYHDVSPSKLIQLCNVFQCNYLNS